ncbi:MULTISPECIES: ATP-binding protein [unclassified Oceanispirochaeta]|uniref:ATP-binding protein n=1 Tax=unclassified Oceanispirochaeta TaxID=2635722 RepID=UPI000E09C6FF|nr:MULTISPECIES: ATP-binding protein [unclassified Oceanispirochaeta]MBF9018666.1 PAS domain S-box protein [Oceanispirochaeta sp. M2]NPD75103.1 PAS domain S-box protein [Oceanispirochaeta sp. M1]RDG29060.1 PAS domain S-box protein [Oceanispirochaeta sp. M1]
MEDNIKSDSKRFPYGAINNKKSLSSIFILLGTVSSLYLCAFYIPVLGRSIIQGWVILSAWTLIVFIRKTDHFYRSEVLTLISYVYFAATSLYLMHLVSLEQTFFFTENMAVQFWHGTGIIESFGLAAIIYLHYRKISLVHCAVFCIVLPIIIIVMISTGFFPACVSVSGGFTIYMKISSVMISILFLLGIYSVFTFFKSGNNKSDLLISTAFLLSACSIFIFALNEGRFHSLIIISYILKALAYHSLYRGVFLEAVLSPLKDLRNTEAELRKDQFFYTQTLAAVKDGMFRYYPKRDLLEVSSIWEEMTGHSLTDHTGNNSYLRELFTQEDQKKLTSALKSADKDGTPLKEEFLVNHKDGSRFWVLMRGRMGIDYDGKPCLIGMMTDISWRKKIEKELILSKEKAEESNRLKTSFLANISHEIRTPLNVILGFTGLLIKDLPDDENTEERLNHIQLIRQSSNQLISIISDIIDISRIQNESISLQIQKVNIQSLLQNLYTVYRKLMDDRAKKEIRLCWSLPDEMSENIYLNTDIERFHQIWQNLLNNAMKFIEYGQISFGIFSYDPELNNIVFFVEDTGPGISSGKDQIIFERFRQGEEGLARRYGGSGLGLSICWEILQQMKGDIKLDRSYAQGARFLFTLPEYSHDAH